MLGPILSFSMNKQGEPTTEVENLQNLVNFAHAHPEMIGIAEKLLLPESSPILAERMANMAASIKVQLCSNCFCGLV